MSVPETTRLVKLPPVQLSCHIQHNLIVFPWIDKVSEHYEKEDKSDTFTNKAIGIKNRHMDLLDTMKRQKECV